MSVETVNLALQGNQDAIDTLIELAENGDKEATFALVKCAIDARNNQVGKWVCERALAKDPAALKGLVARLSGVIVSQYKRNAGSYPVPRDGDALKEFIQEVMVTLVVGPAAALRRYEPTRASLKTYVGVVASNRAKDRVRRELKLLRPYTENELEEYGADPLESRMIVKQVLAALLKKLTPLNRRIFDLFIVSGNPAKYVAQQTNLSEAAIYNRAHFVRKLAKEILNEQAQSSGDGGDTP